MRIAIAVLTILLPAAPAAAQHADLRTGPAARPSAPDRCTPTAGIASKRGALPQARRLTEMPPATQIYSVYTVVGGCPQPIVVRKGIGANRDQPAPSLRTPPRMRKAN